MENPDTLITENTALSLELFHVQTNTSFDFPLYNSVICIGKPHGQRQIDIDVSNFPDADIVSRCHAEIRVEGNTYYIQDLGSSNGTYIRQTKLQPNTPYQLNVGDRIEFGQGDKVTFILQYKQINLSNVPAIAHPTTIQSQDLETNYIRVFSDRPSRTSRFMGLAFMVAGFVMFAANTRIGIFASIPSVVLCLAGVYFLMQRRFNRNIGWILIGLGIAVILFTGNFFASFNLLTILIASTLLFAGYQIFNTGKVLNYGWQDVKKLFKK